jgi:propionate catabolism operon transcriptional regulator
METASSTKQLPVIWGVSAHYLSDLFRLAVPEFGGRAKIEVVNSHFGAALTEIRRRLTYGRCDVIVTAGANAAYLSAHLPLPVVAVRVGGYDLIAALARARQFSDRIAVVLHRHVPSDFQQFVDSFGMSIELRSYETEDDAYNTVHELNTAGWNVVIGAGLVVNLAKQVGMTAVSLYSYDSVGQSINDAIHLVETQHAEKSRREMLATVLYHLKDGVIAVDNTGCLIAANPSAESLAGRTLTNAIGGSLQTILPELNSTKVLTSGLSEAGAIEEINGQTVIVDRAPLLDAGRLIGAVFTLHPPNSVEQAFGKLRAHRHVRSPSARYALADVVQASPQMRSVVRRSETFATRSDATVLITGPSGVGKELLAQGIHNASRRRAHAFVAVNCGALPETLLESELFGYEEGAFTGAKRNGKAGFFEAAHRGTLLLDEIGEMPLLLQSRLLRVLQEREVTRVGGVATIPVDIRIVAATHRNLSLMVGNGTFREDLFYRISVLRISVPPLRGRVEDIDHFLRKFVTAALAKVELQHLTDDVLLVLPEALRYYAWPGNVRELENLAERIALACLENEKPVSGEQIMSLMDAADDSLVQPSAHLTDVRDVREKQHIRDVLAACDGDQTQAARRLGISRTTLWRKLRNDQ